MLKNNYHTHTKFCNHASGLCIDYAKEAIRLGFNDLGMSDHGPLPKELEKPDAPNEPLHRNMNNWEFYNLYLPDFYAAKEKTIGKLNMYLGIETEYIEKYHYHYENIRKQLDYMILGVHFFYIGNTRYNTYEDLNNKTIYGYLETIEKALATGLYDYLAHPDLFFIQYNKKLGDIKWDKDCEIVSRKIIEAAIKNDVYLEINCNGPGNSRRFNHYNDLLYPNLNFWKLVKEYPQAKIIIGADAHSPNDLEKADNQLIYQMIANLGLKVEEKMQIKRRS